MNKHERQAQILDRIQADTHAEVLSTRVLAGEFGVSEITVRRDLLELADAGLVQRRHGGAIRPIRRAEGLRYVGILMVSYEGKFSNPFFNELLEGADSELQKLGYHPAFVKTFAEASTANQIRDLGQLHAIDGLLIMGGCDNKTTQLWKAVTPYIVATPTVTDPRIDTVMIDSQDGMRQMVHHLARLGHQRIGFVMGQEFEGRVPNRVLGYRAGIVEQKLDADPELLVESIHTVRRLPTEIGQAGARKLMGLPSPPDAIMCSSDLIALGAIRWLQAEGYNVPNDVAVTGFDNLFDASIAYPPLTTVHVHKRLLGRLAAEQLHRRIENPGDPALKTITPTSLVIRQSCGGELLAGRAARQPTDSVDLK